MELNDKIKLLIAARQMTPSHFADEIGVQRSSISHILSGRNRPSLEIVQRIVNRFTDITYEWLLESEKAEPNSTGVSSNQLLTADPHLQKAEVRIGYSLAESTRSIPMEVPINGQEATSKGRSIEKILIFYTDNTFTEYTPSPT